MNAHNLFYIINRHDIYSSMANALLRFRILLVYKIEINVIMVLFIFCIFVARDSLTED